jgi:sulfur relay (sulfurtransferase) DsrF/TusC family protein
MKIEFSLIKSFDLEYTYTCSNCLNEFTSLANTQFIENVKLKFIK